VQTHLIFRRAILATTLVAVPSWGWAQSPATTTGRQEESAKPQVQTFEMVLGRAIETAGRNFATRAAEVAPEMMPVARLASDANVSGVAVHDLGLYVFQVQVPGIDLTLQVMNMMVNRPQFGSRRPGAQPAGGQVGSTMVQDDPMGPDSAAPETRTDFTAEYRLLVRDALVDAIIDNAGSLPMNANDTLVVWTSGIDPAVSNPLYRMPTNKLVLRAKGSDLRAFREGKISRDEARRRVQAADF
jgi:hypothetical protein